MWRTHRPKAPERFDEELAAALVAIAERPDSFPVFSARAGQTVRRCLLSKTRCHLYFEVQPATAEVWIIALVVPPNGARRDRGPLTTWRSAANNRPSEAREVFVRLQRHVIRASVERSEFIDVSKASRSLPVQTHNTSLHLAEVWDATR